MLDWDGVQVDIIWERCRRRQWPAASHLQFSLLERRKPCNVLLYWWAGHGDRTTPAGTLPVGPGVCHWSRPGFDYACRQDPGAPLGVTAVHFHLQNPPGTILTARDVALPGEALRVTQPGLTEAVMRNVTDLAERTRHAGTAPSPAQYRAAELLFRGLLLQLLADTTAMACPTGALELAPAYIRDHLAGVLDVDHLARHFGCSRSHFTRRFTALTGQSPKRYVLQARLALARDLLLETDMTVGAVAEHSGFSSIQRFCKQFHRSMGISPGAWRRHSLAAERGVTTQVASMEESRDVQGLLPQGASVVSARPRTEVESSGHGVDGLAVWHGFADVFGRVHGGDQGPFWMAGWASGGTALRALGHGGDL